MLAIGNTSRELPYVNGRQKKVMDKILLCCHTSLTESAQNLVANCHKFRSQHGHLLLYTKLSDLVLNRKCLHKLFNLQEFTR